MINAIFYIALFTPVLSYLSSLNAFRLDMPVIFKQFSYFLLFITLGEFFGFAWLMGLYKLTSFARTNHWFYNIFHFITYLFYLYFFHHVIVAARIRRAIKIIAVIYPLFVIGNFLFGQGLLKLNPYTELLNTFLMVFLSISYYYQVLKSKEIVRLQHDTVFWISTGVLIYHLGSMMLLFLVNITNTFSIQKAQGIYVIVLLSAIIMYLCFTTGFLWAKKKSFGRP